jgi:hypothetical protein
VSGPLILAMGAVYAVISVQFLRTGRLGMGIAFLGYAIGNIGLWLEA